jgi:hypothetical protein
MTSSRTIKPVDDDDVRLATGEELKRLKSMLTFSTSEMVTVEINGGLVYLNLNQLSHQNVEIITLDESRCRNVAM